jgi:predicted nucleic acid-binding protein
VTYLDTSAVLALLAPEPGTALVVAAVGGATNDPLCVSAWTATEVASALGIKVRTRALNPTQATEVLRAFRSELRPTCRMVAIVESDFAAAEALLERFELGLRAGDALHLAIARRLAASAAAVGVVVVALG